MTARHNAPRDHCMGRYVDWDRCHACGKPIDTDANTGGYATDADVCGSTDGPGFLICDRATCDRRRAGLSVEQRRDLYERQCEENDRAEAEGRKSRSVPRRAT